MNDQTIDIHENRQVRMSLKLLYAIFAAVLTSMFILMGTYYQLENKNVKLANKNDMQDLQFQVLKLQVDKLEVEVKQIKDYQLQRRAD